MFDLTRTCLGFYFVPYAPDADGFPDETDDLPGFTQAEKLFMDRVRFMLCGRDDYLQALSCLENALEVRLHTGGVFGDGDVWFEGRVTREADQIVLELAIDEIIAPQGQALDVVAHEVAHVLDMMSEHDGMLPFLDRQERAEWEDLRALEKARIAAGRSPLDAYALTNDREFLAVAVETFFARSVKLRLGAPRLWEFLHGVFRVNPEQHGLGLLDLAPCNGRTTPCPEKCAKDCA